MTLSGQWTCSNREKYNAETAEKIGDPVHDRHLAHTRSDKDGGYIAVIVWKMGALDFGVVDCDHPTMAPEGILGYARTKKGRHYYATEKDPLLKSAHQDPLYLEISEKRGQWVERLFDPDGTPREVPVACESCAQMRHHARAFAMLQKRARLLRLDKPAKEKYRDTRAKVRI